MDKQTTALLTEGISARVAKELPRVVSEPPNVSGQDVYVYTYTHIQVSPLSSPTYEEAFALWKKTLLAALGDPQPPWILWRVKPEVSSRINPETEEEEWNIRSRCTFPTQVKS